MDSGRPIWPLKKELDVIPKGIEVSPWPGKPLKEV
jgi:hypothetical protein